MAKAGKRRFLYHGLKPRGNWLLTKVESEATVKLDYVAAPLQKKRKALVFNKPFIIMLRKKGISHPYLMVKVMNIELMMKNGK